MQQMKFEVEDKVLSMSWDGSTLVVETYSAGPTIRIELAGPQSRQLSDWLLLNVFR